MLVRVFIQSVFLRNVTDLRVFQALRVYSHREHYMTYYVWIALSLVNPENLDSILKFVSSCLIQNAIPCRANCQILFNADLLYVVASNLLSQIYKQIGILFPGHKMALVYKKVKI